MSRFDWLRKERPKQTTESLCRAATETGSFRGVGREGRIVLSRDPTDTEIRAAVATWIEQMARGEYAKAVSAVFSDPPSPEDFRERVETYSMTIEQARESALNALQKQTGMKVNAPPPPKPPVPTTRAKVALPCSNLLDAMEIHREEIPPNAVAWIGFHLPLDNGFGIWTTMGMMRDGDHCVLEFEIFHL